MKVETKYALKLFFSNPAFVQIYYEAVANAFDANADEISISITTDGNIRNPSMLEISIADNGIGFTDDRFDKFKEIKEPEDPFHKGMGRLVYLNYFSAVEVESVFENSKRFFRFTGTDDLDSTVEPVDGKLSRGTRLTFTGFLRERVKSYDDLKPSYLKERLLAQFIPYLREAKKAGKKFKITITLETSESNDQKEFFPDQQVITQDDIPSFITKSISDPAIDTYAKIDINYIVRNGSSGNGNLIAACIDGRTVPLNLFQPESIPVNYSTIFLFESELFTGKSDSSRQRLVLPDSISEVVFYRTLRREVSEILNAEIPEIGERNKKTERTFEEKYPHLSGLFEKETVGLINRDEAIEIAQKRFFRKQKEILECDSLDKEAFEKSLEISSRTLAEYILYRELIIKKMASMKAEDDEAKVHNLIVPRYKTYKENDLLEGIYSNNAWLLDDKFMTFRTILSEAKMHDVVEAITLDEERCGDEGRPDISMIFSADPEDAQKVDVVVVEIKKRKADDKDSPYAATQLVKRARKLVDHCPNIQRVWYYAVIEIDEDLSQLLLDMKWTPLFSKGKVFYQDFQVKKTESGRIVPTPTCLVSYDAIIKDAASRNHTFLEILKNDISNAQKKLSNQN